VALHDLWNLLPSSPAANRQKGDRLPAIEALDRARDLVLGWWERAYRHQPGLARRFEAECRSTLPGAAATGGLLTPESLFEGVMIQQRVLKRDQQLEEWTPDRHR
jgi:hypothetical protein